MGVYVYGFGKKSITVDTGVEKLKIVESAYKYKPSWSYETPEDPYLNRPIKSSKLYAHDLCEYANVYESNVSRWYDGNEKNVGFLSREGGKWNVIFEDFSEYADRLTKAFTAFKSLGDMLRAQKHGYRPTFHVSDTAMLELANIYDHCAEAANLELRAYRVS